LGVVLGFMNPPAALKRLPVALMYPAVAVSFAAVIALL
jgi:hypothetical protein